MNGWLHNTYVTPDDKYAVSGSVGRAFLNVVDLATEEVAWEIKMAGGVRPMTFEVNPDGSTKRIYAQLSDLNGFSVVDFAARKEVARINLPDEPNVHRPRMVRLLRDRRPRPTARPVVTSLPANAASFTRAGLRFGGTSRFLGKRSQYAISPSPPCRTGDLHARQQADLHLHAAACP